MKMKNGTLSMDFGSFILCFVVLVVLGFVVTCSYSYMSKDSVTFTVNKTENVVRVANKGWTNQYLIFTDDETFQNSDSLFYFKFNSSDIYGRVKQGKTYKAEVYGWRVPFFSMYRNIISIKLVE